MMVLTAHTASGVPALLLALVLVSAFLHAAWNALLKKAANLESASTGIIAVSCAATACAVPWLSGRAFPDAHALAWGVGAGCFEGLYFLALAKALDSPSLGWSYTWMRGGSILLVWPLSLLFMGESLRPLPASSVLVVIGGLGLMGLAPGGLVDRRSLKWAGAVASAIAGYTLCYKLSLLHGTNPVPLVALSMAVSLPIQVAVRMQRKTFNRPDTPPVQWGLIVVAGLLSAASFTLYLKVLALGGAGVMATLRNTSVIFAVLLGWGMGEKPTPRQWAGACLVAAGAVGLAWR